MSRTAGSPAGGGASPARSGNQIPYGRQWVDDADVAAVVEVLRSDWLTTGPMVGRFERAFAEVTGAAEAVAVSNGTAALHAIMAALGIGPGDEVIVPPLTFVASANCVVYQGGTPVFADVDPATLLVDADAVEALVSPRTRAIVAVDYAGQPCDYAALRRVASRHGLALVADACHALGARYGGRRVGTLADATAFSLHPVKHITTGEGGVVTTDDAGLAARARTFRNHGIVRELAGRERVEPWLYEVVELGFNYRLTDLQCALGLSQLGKLAAWVARRQAIAACYDAAFAAVPAVTPLRVRPDVSHAYHLYVVQLDLDRLRGATRADVFRALRDAGLGVNVHYVPAHLHPYYRARFGTKPGVCPVAEAAYERLITLPLFPAMTDADVDEVIATVGRVMATFTG